MNTQLTAEQFRSRFVLPRYIMGVDPDLTASGVAIYDRETRTWPTLACMGETELQRLILTYSPSDLLIVVEAGWLNGGLFHGKDTTGWDGKKAKAYGAAIAIQVGKNFGIGFSLLTYCQLLNYPTEQYRPASKKWKADFFRRQTRLDKGYNQEIRDAVRAIWHHIQDSI